jgi:hypothetical protein
MGTTRSYACATQAGLTQLGSNVMRPSRGVLPVRPRRATLASLYLWRGAFIGQHALERCPQKPITIPRSQLCSWNARRELYQHVGHFVGSVVSPLLANIYLDAMDKYMESKYLKLSESQRRRRREQGKGNCLYVRYADDWVVLCNGTKAEAQDMKEELKTLLKHMGLTLSEEKTKLTHINTFAKICDLVGLLS